MVMTMSPIRALAAACLLAPALALGSCVDTSQDIHYIPTPEAVVDEMLRLAELEEGDLLYDLGSGDGRIPIAAARDYGVRAIGIEIDAALVERARKNARQAGVSDLVEFRQQDLYEADISDADVVALYLGDTLNVRLRPKLLKELEPGSRVVSHAFGMGDWIPDVKKKVDNRLVYKWTVPQVYVPGFPSE